MNFFGKLKFMFYATLLAAGMLIPTLRADDNFIKQYFSTPLADVEWNILAYTTEGVVGDFPTDNTFAGIAPDGYAFFAPQLDNTIANSPALLFTSNFTAFALSALCSNTVDIVLDNTDAKARFAIKVAGSWYVAADEYTDTRNNPGTAGGWVAKEWTPVDPASAANWCRSTTQRPERQAL